MQEAGRSSGLNKLGRGKRGFWTAQWVEQAGKGWAPQWIEQVGKGAAEIWTPHKCDPERAPAELHLKSSGFKKGVSGGGTLRANKVRRPVLRCPLPSLFDPSRRPNVSQLG